MYSLWTSPFVQKTYDDTYALLLEAREFAYAERGQHGEDQDDTLKYLTESTRITAQLSQVMAWLLTQKAVDAGEMTEEEALEEPWRLNNLVLCTDASSHQDTRLPRAMRDIMVRSHSLFSRVSRIEGDLLRQFDA